MDIWACMESSMGGADPCVGYAIMKRWYRHVFVRDPNPSQTDVENVRGYLQTLYQR